jgi:hypothetical protein
MFVSRRLTREQAADAELNLLPRGDVGDHGRQDTNGVIAGPDRYVVVQLNLES